MAALAVYLMMSVTDIHRLITLAPLLLAALIPVLALDSATPSRALLPDRLFAATVLLFVASFVASTLTSEYRPGSVRSLAALAPGLIILYTLSNLGVRDSRRLSQLLAFLAGAATAVYTAMLVRAWDLSAEAALEDFRTLALAVPNDIAVAVVLLPATLVCLQLAPKPYVRWAILASLLALLPVLLWIGSRLSLLLLIVLAAACLLSGKHHRRSILLALLLCAAVLLLAVSIPGTIGPEASLLPLDTGNSRISVWAAGISQWRDHPWLGFGTGQFEIAYRLGTADLQFPDWIGVERRMVPWAHNIFLESYLERGVFGLGTQLLLFALLCVRLWERWRLAAQAERPAALALLLCYCAFLVAGLFELTFQRLWVANVFFIFVAAALSPAGVKNAGPDRAATV